MRKEDGVYINYVPVGGADTVSKKLGSATVIAVIYHVNALYANQDVYIPISESPNLYTSGIIKTLDEGGFTFQNGNEFLCNKDGTLYLIGQIWSYDGTPIISVEVNGTRKDLYTSYNHIYDSVEVKNGDIIKMSCRNSKVYAIPGTITMIL